jgi:hypothetical protein
MTNPQVEAARRVMNKFRATVKIDVTHDGAAEIHTPYLIAIPSTRGTPVRVERETAVSEVTRLFTESFRSLQQ